MTLTHRNATLDDVEDIVAIYNQTIPSRMVTADLEPVTVKQKMGWFLDHRPATDQSGFLKRMGKSVLG